MKRSRAARRLHRALGAFTLATGILLVSGCFNPFDPRIAPTSSVAEPPPPPSTPQGVLRLFEWCYDHRAIDEYKEVFTDDFQFVFALRDSAGNAFRDRALTREEEIETATNLFVRGTANEPPANSISLDFYGNLIALPDRRAGKNSRWHKEIAPQVNLRIDTDAEDFRIQGTARLFVVRGDSALIPEELVRMGFSKNDSTRWYIERWEDETLSGPGGIATVMGRGRVPGTAHAAGTSATFDVTWGFVKRLFYP